MKHLLVVFAVALLAFGACTPANQGINPNVALAQRFTDEVWNQGNLAVVDELADANFTRHNPESWSTPITENAEAFKAYVTQIRTMFPDFHVEVETRLADGDLLAARWTVTGTHAELNKQISLKGITISRYANGKLAEEWVSWDTHGFMQQLGMTAMPETTAK